MVLLPSFAFLRSDERLDEVGGCLYLELGEIFFDYEILRCRENCITLLTATPASASAGTEKKQITL